MPVDDDFGFHLYFLYVFEGFLANLLVVAADVPGHVLDLTFYETVQLLNINPRFNFNQVSVKRGILTRIAAEQLLVRMLAMLLERA